MVDRIQYFSYNTHVVIQGPQSRALSIILDEIQSSFIFLTGMIFSNSLFIIPDNFPRKSNEILSILLPLNLKFLVHNFHPKTYFADMQSDMFYHVCNSYVDENECILLCDS